MEAAMQTCAWCRTTQATPGRYCENCGAVLASATESEPEALDVPSATVVERRTQIAAVGYGGFWVRWLALLIDSVILFVPVLILRGLLGNVGSFLIIVGYWLYFALFESSSWQATPGKRMLGLAVVKIDGTQLTFGRATGRYFAKILSYITLCIGFLMAGFTSQKRALHDYVAETLVVKRATAAANRPVVYTDAV
jgi:uncharacterized RDD family membrane protein YckC